MKKKIISCTLSAAMLFSASLTAMPQNVLADAYSATQKVETGKIIFPNDYISFESTSKIIYNGSVTKEISGSGSFDAVATYRNVTSSDVNNFYGWRILSDTFNAGKRTALEVAPVFIIYDSEKADLAIDFPASGTATKPTIRLIPKDDYLVDSVASGVSYNKETNEITLTNPSFDSEGNINLGDSYHETAPTITLYKDTTPINNLTICPETNSNIKMQFNAKAVYASGAEATDSIIWSLNDDIEEFISIDNHGLVTVTPYFSGDDFTVTACIGDSSASAVVHLQHSFGEWSEKTAPTLTTEGVSARECSLCHVQETQAIEKLQDKGFPTGTITINGNDNWSDLVSTIDFYSYSYRTANIIINATDDVQVKNVSYYISNIGLTYEQLNQITAWIPGNQASLTADGKYVIYAKITDSADNVSYISTNGILIDTKAPVISGITDGQIYNESKSFTVSDDHLKAVKINGVDVQAVNGLYTLNRETTSSYIISASDIAGNTTTYNVSILPSTYTDENKITGITEDGTYRRGSLITFTAKGYNMDLTNPVDGDIRFIPTTYKIDKETNFTTASFKQSISTSLYRVGSHSLVVTFTQQKYSSLSGWTSINVTDKKTVNFKLQKRTEIDSARAAMRASFFTIKFETNGGTKIDYVLVNRSKYLSEPVSPTKVGYKFDGWYTDEKLTKEYDFSQRVSSNMTLYAKWVKSSSADNDNMFTDVSKDDWYYDNIAYVYATGLMNGTGDAEFSPDMPTTRAMIVTILYRLEGEPTTAKSSFYDVSPDAYYAKAVSWAQENDIVNGMTLSTFAPDNEISREQLMTILYRYAEYKDYDLSSKTGLGNYTDSDQISAYANNAFQWAIATKVATGRTEKFLHPKASATRAEVAMAFQNFIEGNEQ